MNRMNQCKKTFSSATGRVLYRGMGIVLLFSAVLMISHMLYPENALAEDRIRIDPSINVGICFTDNLFYNFDHTKESDLYGTLEFGLPANIPLYIKNLDVSVGYQLKTIIYANNSQLNNVFHVFNAGLGFDKKYERRGRQGRHLSVTLNEGLSTTMRVLRLSEWDPSNQIQINTLALPINYKMLFSRLSKMELYFTPSWLTYLDSDGNDHWDLDVGAKYWRRLRTGSPLAFTAYIGLVMRNFTNSQTKTYVDDGEGEPELAPVCSWKWLNVEDYYGAKGMLGLELAYSRLSFSMGAGYEYDLYSSGGLDNKANLVFDLNTMYKMSRSTDISIKGTQLMINDIVGELILSRMVRLAVTQHLGIKTQVSLGAGYSMFESEAYGSFDKWGLDLKASYQIVRNLRVQLTVSHDVSTTGDVGICEVGEFRDWDANRFFLNFTYQFKSISIGVPREI